MAPILRASRCAVAVAATAAAAAAAAAAGRRAPRNTAVWGPAALEALPPAKTLPRGVEVAAMPPTIGRGQGRRQRGRGATRCTPAAGASVLDMLRSPLRRPEVWIASVCRGFSGDGSGKAGACTASSAPRNLTMHPRAHPIAPLTV
eukprot:363419-Chlamydomonas_euryale.AAC.12